MNSPTAGNRHRTVIIGVGNELRGDDAAGVIVARRLLQAATSDSLILEQSGEGAALIESMIGVHRLIIIDAAQSGAAAGTIHRFDAGVRPVPAKFFHYSTHAFGVAEAIETARALGQLPPEVIVYGIEGQSFEYGAVMSSEVSKAVEGVVTDILSQLTRRP